MARPTTKRKPTHALRHFNFFAPGGSPTTGRSLLSVASGLSKVNHRLYRQGRQYRLKIDMNPMDMPKSGADTFPQVAGQGIAVWALMPTWFVHGMWRQAKRAYDMALDAEKKALAGQNLARWRDFRVESGLDALSLQSPEGEGLDPVGYSSALNQTTFAAGEFGLSTVDNVETAGVQDMTFTFGDPTSTKFSLWTEFSRSRNESSSPENIITDMPYHELQSDANSADYEELQDNGNEPPYNADSFPGALWVKVGELGATAIVNSGPTVSTSVFRGTTGYFDAPCGLVAIENNMTDGDDAVDVLLTCEVQTGTYLGVHAPAMG